MMHSKVMMVRPASFGYNPETAKNNSFQNNDKSQSAKEIAVKAIEEFDQLVSKLRSHGIEVVVLEDTKEPHKPDAIFPNNWVSFHDQHTIVTYPMYSPLRRLEKRKDLVGIFQEEHGYKKWYTFDHYEEDGFYLEGTGSMILDRENKFLFACLGPRTDIKILEKFCILMNYRKFHFYAVDDQGQDIYHTNVMMTIADNYAIVCMDTVKDPKENAELRAHLDRLNKELIEITIDQMNQFAGNMLQLRGDSGRPFLVMSKQAFDSLTVRQLDQVRKHNEIIYSDIATIENYGGGSARCMIAEMD